ncbi:GNAT family N-acetyltransferase [Roseicyclus marinus]|uniref:GNAT family N-acetyltransferase n=1 Tax=Roseicyclus marinus TaxID=2161673 RepID=UPI00241018F5|nr:N-acetyltransferase [Roseicyclus marinus]MDG3042945.1 N-acetyltransferase [Roseicyclus marinus]
MDITTNHVDRKAEIAAPFATSFGKSEGEDEGAVIKQLVSGMLGSVDAADLLVVSALDGGEVIGSVVFTRLRYPRDARVVFLLSPMAVAPGWQGQGVGLALLQGGLAQLRGRGVDVVLTYGDIGFYGRGGFVPVTQDAAAAPLPLSYPEGWLGRNLVRSDPVSLTGPSRCVAPLEKPELW